MWKLAISVVLIVLGTAAAERFAVLKKTVLRQGLWFGFLSITALFFAVGVGATGSPVALLAAPPVIAAFFFAPAAGLIAGVTGGCVRALMPLLGEGGNGWFADALAIVLVSCYAAAMAKWVFLNRRPPVVTAAIGAGFGEVLHLAILYLLGYRDLSGALEFFYAARLPLVIGTGAAAGLAAFPCGSWRGWRRNFLSSLTLVFLFFGLALAVVGGSVRRNASRQTQMQVLQALDDLETAIDEEIGFILHSNGMLIAEKLHHAQPLTLEEARRLARAYDVDELNVKDGMGHTLASTDPRVLDGSSRRFKAAKESNPYFDIVKGRTRFIQQKFRPGINNPEIVAKYVGVAFPGGGGFLQLGYSWSHLGRRFAEFFFPMLQKTRVGKTGYFIVADPAGRILVSGRPLQPGDGRMLTEIGMSLDHQLVDPREDFEEQLFGVWCRCSRFRAIGSYRIFAVLPVAETHGPAVQNFFITALVLFIFCIAFRLILLRFQLAQKKIDQLRAAEERRREEDLALAHTIQCSELRVDNPDTPFYRVNAAMTPAREVGGDFYGYTELPDGRLLVAVADVSGKGIPAAIFMMKAKEVLQSFSRGFNSVEEVAAAVNARLASRNDALMFVTAWFGVLEVKSGVLEYVSAGHNPPLIKRVGGTVEWLPGTRSLALAVMESARFTPERVTLKPGDALFLYTDGVTEAVDPKQELYGEARLEACLRQASGALLPAVREDLAKFTAGAPQADDVTMLSLEFKAYAPKQEG